MNRKTTESDIEYSIKDNQTQTAWRLINDEAASGERNMAVDEALLRVAAENVPQEDAPPILRFYDWNPACLSIGRFQKADALHLDASQTFVRRPTGGRAVWHQHEITYSVVMRESLLPRDARSVAASYRWMSEGFLRGLRDLGVNAQIGDEKTTRVSPINQTSSTRSAAQTSARDATTRDATTNCFDAATRADFVVDGRKILGAAQCREGGVILQHGSLLLDIDHDLWCAKAGGSLCDVVTLRALGVVASRDEIIDALARGFGKMACARLEKSVLSPREKAMAKTLLQKHQSARWKLEGKS